jgi:hypothetical protein
VCAAREILGKRSLGRGPGARQHEACPGFRVAIATESKPSAVGVVEVRRNVALEAALAERFAGEMANHERRGRLR